jgi:hypothetical protein
LRDLNYQFKQLGENGRDSSLPTPAKRAFLLRQVAAEL